MSTSGRSGADAPAASDVAARLREAGFVRLVAAADGDAIAGAGVLASALSAADVPFQLTVTRPWDRADRTTDADLTVTLGGPDVVGDVTLAGGVDAVSHTAFEIGRALDGPEPDPLLALAGTLASGHSPGSLADAAGVERRPGIAVPTEERTDGLAHSTLVHAPFSGDEDRAATALESIDLAADDADRRVASLLALSVLGEPDATPRAAECVERALRPYEGGPFETVGGYADVLDSVAREQPGTGVALALGHDARAAALDAWRTHGSRAQQALRSATTGRYDGLFVARGSAADLGVTDPADVPVGTAARLLRDFRSPEPVALFVTDGRAGAAATGQYDLDATMREAATAVDGQGGGSPRRAQARFETDTAEFIMAVREAL